MVRISSWNFVRVPKAWLWTHIQSVSLKFSWKLWFLQIHKFQENILESSRNVSETTPWSHCISIYTIPKTRCIDTWWFSCDVGITRSGLRKIVGLNHGFPIWNGSFHILMLRINMVTLDEWNHVFTTVFRLIHVSTQEQEHVWDV